MLVSTSIRINQDLYEQAKLVQRAVNYTDN